MFLNSPDKSQITLSGECEHCKKEVSIDIVPTSGGYGVLGGALIDLTPDQCYRLLCPVCHTHSMQANPENERSKVKGVIHQ